LPGITADRQNSIFFKDHDCEMKSWAEGVVVSADSEHGAHQNGKGGFGIALHGQPRISTKFDV
jgi:hypothetical protein